jgi:antitoxin VapB
VLCISQWDIRGVDVNKQAKASGAAAVFKSNRSQAVRIPKALAFPDDVKRVSVTRLADGSLLLTPEQDPAKAWADYLREGPFLDADFPADIPDMPPRSVPSFDD